MQLAIVLVIILRIVLHRKMGLGYFLFITWLFLNYIIYLNSLKYICMNLIGNRDHVGLIK